MANLSSVIWETFSEWVTCPLGHHFRFAGVTASEGYDHGRALHRECSGVNTLLRPSSAVGMW